MFGPWIAALMAILQACYLHQVDYSFRLPCRPMLGYLLVFVLFHNVGSSLQVQTWRRRLQHFSEISLQGFSSMMQRQFAVYVLLHVDIEPTGRGSWLQNKSFYVGSTITGLHVRQDVRWRKHRCLEQGQFVNVELVMHYLHSRGLLHDVAILPLFNLVNATDTRSKELEIIQSWRPMYNHPWINRLHPTSTFRTTKLIIQALGYTTKSSRLWQKVRRRMQTLGILQYYADSTSSLQGWDILMMLAAGGRLAFEASRRLRSSEFSPMHVFALHRLSNHLDDPPRTKVKSSLVQVLKFRQLAVPKLRKPLVIPFLAHLSFKQSVRAFLRHHVLSSKEFLIPFHLPSVQVVAGKQQSMKDLFYNHLREQQSWSWSTPPSCSCTKFLLQHPELQRTRGHIASPLKALNISKRLRHILSFSAETPVAPSLQDYIACTSIKVQHWMHQNGINCYDPQTWSSFVTRQWPYHVQAAWITIKKKDIMFLRQLLRGYVVHGRDHAINEMFMFCPLLYWQVVKATYGDQQVYRTVSMSPMQTEQFLLQQSQQGWLKRYPWGRTMTSSTLPIAYILLKQKKHFLVARPIISYKFFIFAKLFRATAIVLDIIAKETMPDSFGLQTFPAMMQQIRQFFSSVSDDCCLACYNQDLVGFFTSIPVSRIMEAVDWMLQQFMLKHNLDPATYSFSVNLSEKDSKLRVWKGKARAAGRRMYQIYFRDILAIVRMSCDSSYFTVLGECLRNKEEQLLVTKYHRYWQALVLLFWSKPGSIGIFSFYSFIVLDFYAFGMLTTELFLLIRSFRHIQLFRSFFMMTFTFLRFNWRQ